MVAQLLIMLLLLLVVPTMIGGLFAYMDKESGGLLFRWIGGQFLLWAGFQLISVPLILKQESFSRVVLLFEGYMAAMVLLATAAEIRRGKQRKKLSFRSVKGEGQGGGMLLWLVFWMLLLFQLVQAVRLVYEDSDDAYYVAVANITERSDTMYRVLPYTGGGTQLDARHGLASFSIWIAFLARVSGMHPVTVAQTVLPVVMIAMAYGIYYLFSVFLFPEKGGQQPLFLIFTEMLVLFGNYSVYTTEIFLIGRSRQGKASLGSIVFPFLILLFLKLVKKLQVKEKIPSGYYLLIAAATITGCLCSTLGALLICIIIGIVGILIAVFYKKPQVTFLLAACCIPCIGYAFLYLILK